MSTKTSIFATVGLIALAIGGGLAYLATLSASQADRAAEPLGSAMAILIGVGVAIIWFPWLMRWQNGRKAAAANAERTNAKRPERRGRPGR
ncbi:hypothetical protein [Alienimonas californiensis]|uniref:Uncharacterized protein n=1 Tax=Alienimonas californiensis TaxID=2527989 RepID=A0A517P4S4_9PLAN|nr:hypothetical protein [Alienimonas californiensis]QDT14387.1 hypothetical protein CA12_04600 [Alienimonas californiensis]